MYYPEGREIHCQLREESAGNLVVILAAPGNRLVQQTNAESVSTTASGSGSRVNSGSSSVARDP